MMMMTDEQRAENAYTIQRFIVYLVAEKTIDWSHT